MIKKISFTYLGVVFSAIVVTALLVLVVEYSKELRNLDEERVVSEKLLAEKLYKEKLLNKLTQDYQTLKALYIEKVDSIDKLKDRHRIPIQRKSSTISLHEELADKPNQTDDLKQLIDQLSEKIKVKELENKRLRRQYDQLLDSISYLKSSIDN